MTEPDTLWLARLQALGRAQSRYLWILLVMCLFYAALVSKQTTSSANSTQPTVPLVGLELSSRIVAASGPAVISFLVLAITGSLRAYSYAREQANLGQGADFAGEKADVNPNALDLAFYSPKGSPRVILVLTYFKYPVFLTGALVLAMWVWRTLPTSVQASSGAVGAVLWLGAAYQVLTMYWGRFKQVPKLWRTGQ